MGMLHLLVWWAFGHLGTTFVPHIFHAGLKFLRAFRSAANDAGSKFPRALRSAMNDAGFKYSCAQRITANDPQDLACHRLLSGVSNLRKQ
eukprot:scaffold312500_cov17-Tisochrysis_lutea.AAC.1